MQTETQMYPLHELEVLLDSMNTVGHVLEAEDEAVRRYWGKHLLEDWKSLRLMLERMQP